MGHWLKSGWLLGAIALTGCMTTQRQARQESAVPLLEERLARLEQRVEAIETTRRQEPDDLDWHEFPDALESEVHEPQPSPRPASVRATTTDTGRFVKPSAQEIQRALKAAGYYQGSVDGKVGPKTQAAIRQFQKDHGLVVDGKVGRATWGLLGKYLEG